MIAKRTIIRDERILRGMLRENTQDDPAWGVVDMAIALQWHVVFNGTEPVALATSRSTETGVGEKDVLLVVCDCKQGRTHDLRAASALARYIFDAYHSREAKSSVNGADSGVERLDFARWLANAITGGLKYLCQTEPMVAGQTVRTGQAASPISPSVLTEPLMSVVAAVIHHDKLLVARYGGGCAYLLRNGMLQNLTDDSFTDVAHAEQLEPDLGQLDLAGEDRILLCTDAFHHRLQDAQIRSVLRSTPSSRRAAQTLLDIATKEPTNDNMALAVADYVTGRTGTYALVPVTRAPGQPVYGPKRGTFRTLVALAALLVFVAIFGTGIVALSSRGGIGSILPNVIVNASATPDATLGAFVYITETAVTDATIAPTESLEPSATPTNEIAPTNTPEPAATFEPTPTATVEPTFTATPEATAASAGNEVLTGAVTYTVKAGDVPIDIAVANNTSLEELLRNNPGLDPTGLQVGQVLIIKPGAVAPTEAVAPPVAPPEPPTPTATPTRRPRPRPTRTPLPPTATPMPPTPIPAPTETPAPLPQPPGDSGAPPPPPPPTSPPCLPGATCP